MRSTSSSCARAHSHETGPERGDGPDPRLPVDDRTDAAASLSLPADLLALRIPGHRTLRGVQGRLADAQTTRALPAIWRLGIRPRPVSRYAILHSTLALT